MSGAEAFCYWLATSAISFTGTCTTTTTSASGGKTTTKYQSNASLITRADGQSGPVSLLIKDDHADNKLSLGLTEDGRLTSSGLDSKGEGGILLGAAVSMIAAAVTVAATAAGAVAAVAEDYVPDAPDGTSDEGDTGTVFPGQTQLDQLTVSERQLTSYLIKLSDHIAGDAGGTSPPSRPRPDDLSVVQTAFDLISEQRDRLIQELVAWETAKQSTSSTSASYTVDVQDLPIGSSFDPTQAMSSAASAVWAGLGVIMCVVDDHEPQVAIAGSPLQETDGAAPFQDGAANSIWYRLPRRVRLDLWKRSDGDGESAELVQSSQVEIVDKHCLHISIPLHEGGFFGHKTISVKLGTLGTPTSISDEQVPSLVDAATAFSKAPGLISGGISDASGIITAWQKAVPSAATQQTAALQAQKDRLQVLADIKKLGGAPET